MKRFGYLRDPLCATACVLYALNRWWLRDHVGGAFLHGYFNDLLLIPAALPVALWIQRRMGVRSDDRRPAWGEIGMHLAVWSVTAEWLMPHWTHRATGDLWDVVAYSVGAVVAGCWWQAAAWL